MKPLLQPLRLLLLVALAALLLTADTQAQRGRRGGYSGPGTVSEVSWSADGKSLYFTSEDQRYEFDLKSLKGKEIEDGDGKGEASQSGGGGRSGASTGEQIGRPTRGRQHTQVDSPDGKWEAHYRDWNVVLVEKEGGKETAVTKDGDADIHYGTASWVYGEELDQVTAMWWSPDSKKLLYYRFDDTGVLPFHLVTGWTEINTVYYPEYYPKAGATNPGAELMVYDLASKRSKRVDAGGGREEYLYGVLASPDGDEVMIHWTDRLQHDMKLLAIDLKSGKTRVVVEEHQDTWQDNHPSIRWLADGRRFLWETDKSGYTHYELRDLSGKLLHPVTAGEFQTDGV
ncbi:MAG: DPP IV N-terminal domain-containing protein, partial [Planctomycetes bacterium]|nr:DPP IV N-terminal domain-containing protein [Planctomycetota bacterium]